MEKTSVISSLKHPFINDDIIIFYKRECMGKLKTKNLKESEFIRYIETHPVFSESLCKKHEISSESLGYSLYVHSNHFFWRMVMCQMIFIMTWLKIT